ncbi:MAG: aldo/keto reductase [Microcoleaceae cyanobacterium]
MFNLRRTRRQFLFGVIAVTSGIVSACQKSWSRSASHNQSLAATAAPPQESPPQQSVQLSAPEPQVVQQPASSPSIPTRTLGRTQLTVPLLGLGGSASPLSKPAQEKEAIAMIERAFELGIRYFDTAANYGPSEERLGKVLPAKRSEVIIATKTSSRNRDEAWRQLERSLQRLQTDRIDLWQFHAVTHDWDIDTILSRNGAIKAAEEAKAQGIIRHIGVTGHHNPEIFVTALNRYSFDTALIPVNAADKHTPQPFIKNVLPLAQKNNTGIIAMKVPAYGRLFKPGVLTGMSEAMGYALSQPGVHCCIVAAATLEQLEQNVAAAQTFKPLSSQQLASIEQRTASVWQENSFFRSWG